MDNLTRHFFGWFKTCLGLNERLNNRVHTKNKEYCGSCGKEMHASLNVCAICFKNRELDYVSHGKMKRLVELSETNPFKCPLCKRKGDNFKKNKLWGYCRSCRKRVKVISKP